MLSPPPLPRILVLSQHCLACSFPFPSSSYSSFWKLHYIEVCMEYSCTLIYHTSYRITQIHSHITLHHYISSTPLLFFCLILYKTLKFFELIKYFIFFLKEINPYVFREIIYKWNIMHIFT